MPWSRNGHVFAYVRLWVSWEQRLTSGRGYTSSQLSTGQEAFLPEWKGYRELSSTPSASTWHSQVAPWKAGAWPRLPVCHLQGYSPTCLRERESNSGVGSSHGAYLECGPVWAQLYSLGTPPYRETCAPSKGSPSSSSLHQVTLLAFAPPFAQQAHARS